MQPYPIDPSCPHCNDQLFALKHPLLITEQFRVVCDVHPLAEGHILIIPKQPISCVGEFSPEMLEEFIKLYDSTSEFVKATYGSVSSFEHGKIGQTVYHAHVHILPFDGKPEDIISEGSEHMTSIQSMKDVQSEYKTRGQYLFFSVGEGHGLVDTKLGCPRFFRDRFAKAQGQESLGDWQSASKDPSVQAENLARITNLENNWNRYNHFN